MIWPSPEKATLLIWVAHSICRYARPRPQTRCCRRCLVQSRRPPEKPTRTPHGDVRIERIDRIGLELGTQSKSQSHVEEDDPPQRSGRTATDRDDVAGRMTQMRLSCTRDVFLLQGSLRAWKARTKSVVAIGIALFLKTSYDDPTPAASIGYSFVDTVSSRQSRPSTDAASSLA
jgi:hypothetical protein